MNKHSVTVPQPAYRIGLVLSGGGAKGFAHAGAIRALEEAGIRPDIIAGTSAGAIVGACYAAGLSPEQICREFLKHEKTDFMKVAFPRNGFFSTAATEAFFRETIPAKRIEDTSIPLRVVATDFDHGRMQVFSEGELAPRLMASACVPIFFQPVEIDGTHYVDGGLFKNFPVSVIRDECRYIIGINVSPILPEYRNSIRFIAERSYHYMSKANSVADKQLCDCLVEIEEALKYGMFDLDKTMEIFELGYQDMKHEIEGGLLDPIR